MGERRGTKGLELWCRRMTDGYPGVKIENMTTSWRDGLAFCAIIHRFRPDLIDFSKLKKNDVYHNNELAFRIAERHLGIPALLEPEDMVAFPVPDRLSILTYLSQFYQVFAVQGSSPNRIAPKRTPTSPDHSSIVSSPSTSPPSKVTVFEAGRIHREPCAKCALPVFLSERLNVGKLLYHRTCFKCARCTAQLTFDNYYETENGAYCCETCPDEEIQVMPTLKNVQSDEQTSVLLRSVSDEEKTASLRMNFDDVDEYSAVFETALELPDDKCSITSEQSKEFTMARTHFMQTQLVDNEEVVEYKSECELNNEENDSGFPNKLDSNVNSIQSSNSIDSVSENFDKTAENIVTKDKSVIDEGNERNESSSTEEQVTSPLNLVEIKLNDDNIPMADDDDDEITSTEQMSFTNNIKVDEDNKLDKSEDSLKEDIVVISDESVLSEEMNKVENSLKDDSVIVISDNSVVSEEVEKSKEYPDELNPFDEEEEDEEVQQPRNSTNPFEEENDIVHNLKPTPSPRLKKKHIVPNSSDRVSMPLYIQRVSMEHSDSLPIEPPTPASRKKRKMIPAPKLSLNPFGSSDEDDERSENSMDKLPIPTPRLSRTSTDSQSPSSHIHGSNTSLSSNSTAATVTLRKKKPAPKPPGTPLAKLRATEPPGSPSITHSPFVTPNHRKSRKAPPPPPPPTQSNVSTPCVDRRVTEVSFNMSPISVELQHVAQEQQIENEKCVKDETNRNRQSEEYKNERSSSFDSRNHVLNKSLHGKWKRRKGQAPSRPIPQKRTIKALPMDEIRRELDVIEIQLQGLEKQGVQIEKLIREKCENDAETVDAIETSLPPDVEELILQLFELVNDRNELFRKQTELMYLKRQQRLEEEHADVEYQIRCLMLKPEANKTDLDKGREETLIKRLLEIVEMRNEIIECLEMDRVRETEEDNCINNHLTMYTTKNDGTKRKPQKEKKKHKREKLFKFKTKTTDADKDIDESETSVKQEKKKKHLKFF